MRFLDLLGLSLSALWQQKVRVVLTTLGVVFGSLVLAISLSVREGVHETVSYEYQKFGELRLIDVHRSRFSKRHVPPAELLQIKGKMSDEKRKRLEEEITDRWQRGFVTTEDDEPSLTREKVAQIAALDHVRSVQPLIHLFGRAFLADRAENVSALGAAADDAALKEQLVAGQTFAAADSPSVIVSEYLLYQLGVVDDAAVDAVVGKTLRLELQEGLPGHFSVLALLRVSGKDLAVADERILEGIAARVPEALAKMDLAPEEKAIIEKLLARKAAEAKPDAALVRRELTICGVMAAGAGKKRPGRFAWSYGGQDLVLPTRTAQDLHGHFPHFRKHGYDRVFVEVDHTDHVKEVNEKIKELGLESHTLIEYIEQEQFTYLLIFTSMTIVALIALLVAALGITNTMLMSVLERVREIGIMKAVGARELHVRLIFLIEGGLIGLVGGLLGLLLAWGLTFPADAWVKSMIEQKRNVQLDQSIFAFPWWLVLGVPFFAWLVTTLAAYYPARRAARTDPIQALRHE